MTTGPMYATTAIARVTTPAAMMTYSSIDPRSERRRLDPLARSRNPVIIAMPARVVTVVARCARVGEIGDHLGSSCLFLVFPSTNEEVRFVCRCDRLGESFF